MTAQTISQLFDLTGKGAVVTGGAMGIGQAIAFRLAEAGASVLVTDIDIEAAQRTVNLIEARGGHAAAVKADARSAADAERVAASAVRAFGNLSILVNNAGIYPMVPFMDLDEALWDKVLDTNLKGAFLYSKAAAREMINHGKGGRIINIASIAAVRPFTALGHYNASKGGILMLTKAMALELASHRILVNAVAPGTTVTPGLGNNLAPDTNPQGPPDQDMVVIPRTPLGRLGEPDDIARVVLFLASAAADYVTGEMIVVDGGYLLS